MEVTAAGLGAAGFWFFIAAVVVGGMWYSIRENDAKHETLRRMVESGTDIDEELMDRVLGTNKRLDRELKLSGVIVMFVAPGLAMLGWFVSMIAPGWLLPMFGVAALVAFCGVGLWMAGRFVERSQRENDLSGSASPGT